jgi:hypothetical protein
LQLTAGLLGTSLASRAKVTERAIHAVADIEERVFDVKGTGDLKLINRSYKQQRADWDEDVLRRVFASG